MRNLTSMPFKKVLKHTKGCSTPCPHCGCWSIRIPKDGSPPFCVYDRCPHAWRPDPKLRPGAPSLRAVEDE